MTREFNQVSTFGSRVNSFITGAFMVSVIVLAGVLSFAPYSLI